MSDEPQTVEASNPLLGSVKLIGPHTNTIATVATLIIVCVLAYILNAHAGDAKEGARAVATELKEANKEVAATLKESNKEISKVLQELSAAMRESNCLAQFPKPEDKARNAELCKRISR